MTITIELKDDTLQQLTRVAAKQGVRVDDLVEQAATEYLRRHPSESFEAAAQYVLQKNAELYRRLAQ